MARQVYYIEYDGGGKYAWEAEEDKYKEIASACGIKKAGNSTKSLFFGANKPKPPRVRLNFEEGRGDCGGSQLIFCDPDKLVSITQQNKLKGKKSNGMKIKSASLPR
ncbi:MAG: hypothetical protein AAGD25_40580 [Cyanobacteria bacterium P01_F01_bin.150]